MKSISKASGSQAIDTLKTFIQQVSAIRMKDIDAEMPVFEHKIDIGARIEVLGHDHTVACKVHGSHNPGALHDNMISKLHESLAQVAGSVTPVIILPR